MALLKELESAAGGTRVALKDLLAALPYNEQGLLPAIAQDHGSKTVLMLAWMDRSAIEQTLESGYATYYSRSRQTYWRKGETSGHLQRLVSLHIDCDGDALLLTVEQTGPACHTLREHCFYIEVSGDQAVVTRSPG